MSREIVTWVRTPPDAPRIRGTESRCSECGSLFDRWTKGIDPPLAGHRNPCPHCGAGFGERPEHIVVEREEWVP